MMIRKVSGKPVRHERRATRQREALERQIAHSKRSVLEQLELIKHRPGESKREVARLNKMLG